MKKSKGFTLIELVIVIVIIGILAIIAVPLYRGYTRRAMASEGNALLGSIASSQKIYYANHGSFLALAGSQSTEHPELGIDPKANKYFSAFNLAASGSGTNAYFSAYTRGNGDATNIACFISGYVSGPAVYSATGISN